MIIAVDFDGILAKKTDNFPEIGPPVYNMVSFARELIDEGHEVVLWTSRTDKALEDAIEWCEDRGLHFCAVNENAPTNIAKWIEKYPSGTRKVSADLYLDDHNPWFVNNEKNSGHEKAIESLIMTVRRLVKCWTAEN